MDGLILLVILVPLIILILLISILSRAGDQRRLLESLSYKIKNLSDEIADLTKELARKKEGAFDKNIITDKPVAKETYAEPIKESIKIPEPVKKEKVIPIPVITREFINEEPADLSAVNITSQSKESEKKADLEKFIGENLANKIGIAVLVLGIAFFVKYAIDKNWINETVRVIIGFVSGSILIGLAHRYRNSYRSFSSVLVGGGLSVYYFSIAFAFHQYHLIGQTAAFIYMVLVSGFAVILSVFYNRQELAILATIGGFVTPFLVSTGNENHIALFTYLCILNTGLIALSWFKRWPAINIIALFFTTIIFGSWLIRQFYFGYMCSQDKSETNLSLLRFNN